MVQLNRFNGLSDVVAMSTAICVAKDVDNLTAIKPAINLRTYIVTI